MPPRSHSSSHHHSSHSSRPSHHSSSHHSRPSRHSSSHHSSGHIFSHTRSSTSYQTRPIVFASFLQTAPNRRIVRTARHQYTYVPDSWTDSENNTHTRGYYTEDGIRYDIAAEYDRNRQCYRTAEEYKCDYCDSLIFLSWQENEAPHCPNCGANLSSLQYERCTPDMQQDTYRYQYTADTVQSSPRLKTILIICTGFIIGILLLMATIIMENARNSLKDTGSYSYSQSAKSIYVKELGRNVPYSEEYESYYDSQTDCYFWYNNESEPACWQYWYEGISSDYGDYGWMEYDEPLQQWFIETSDGIWQTLPDKYDTSRLWHFTENHVC